MNESRNTRILVVDDEVTHLQALCDSLRYHGFDVVDRVDADSAVEVLEAEHFDMLLTDLHLPRADGIALMLEAQQRVPFIATVVMTGAGTVEKAVAAMRAGAVDFVVKPLRMRDVLPVLERALQIRNLRIDNAALAERVREQRDALLQANRHLEAFSYSVSHDLRGPLHVIGGFSSALQERARNLDETERSYLSRIRAAANRMDGLVDAMLELAHVGKLPLRRERVDMELLAHRAAEEAGTVHGLEAGSFEIEPALPAAAGDSTLLLQVFANLLSNACKFSAQAAPPRIAIGSQPGGRGCAYFVRDNGVGFDGERAERMFQPFQRFHRETEFPGLGIGLSIVHRIVERHGGRVWATSSPGAGSCFHFELG